MLTNLSYCFLKNLSVSIETNTSQFICDSINNRVAKKHALTLHIIHGVNTCTGNLHIERSGKCADYLTGIHMHFLFIIIWNFQENNK